MPPREAHQPLDGGALPLLPLRNMTLFPGVTQTVDLGRHASVAAVKRAHERARGQQGPGTLIVATQREPMVERPGHDDLHRVAVLAELVQVLLGVPGRMTAVVRGLRRVHVTEVTTDGDHLVATHRPAHETTGDPTLGYALAGALQDLMKLHDNLLPTSAKNRHRAHALGAILGERSPGLVADLSAAHLDLDVSDRQTLLLELQVNERLRRLIEIVSHRVNVLQVKRDLDRHVRDHLSRHEHEALLRHKLRAIQSELGTSGDDDDEQVTDDLERRLDSVDLPPEVAAVAERELHRLRRMNPQGSEAVISRTYVEWLVDLPWGDNATEDKLDIAAARALLEAEHFGLARVKKRVIEYLSVRKLAPGLRGPILCLAGPPGVGKTSLAQSIAVALGRKFVRASLGGLRDDAEIRGHRRTYVGSLPGRIIQGMKKAGVVNPVFLLDEIDKLTAPDLRGDPAGALLEVLDPEQNDAFEDHYLAVPYDLSRVIFVCTANDPSRIPSVLLDRLELIELTGYTTDEKVAIARRHLMPRALADGGLQHLPVTIDDAAFSMLACEYTRESGVRELQRQIEALLRDVAMVLAEGRKPPTVLGVDDVTRILGRPKYFAEVAETEPVLGVVTGLGWTPAGGRLMFVEAMLTDGDGTIRLTGKLGEIMKESGQTAVSMVRSMAATFGIGPDFLKDHDVHVHLPQSGVPKDGPSAGVTVTTALVSILTGRPVRPDVAMTGEITLRGRVLPVGGIREKIVAAHRAGIREVILPEHNRKDEPEIPPHILADIRLHFVSNIQQVLDVALLAHPDQKTAAE